MCNCYVNHGCFGPYATYHDKYASTDGGGGSGSGDGGSGGGSGGGDGGGGGGPGDDDCGETYTEPSGDIFSPNYPDPYPSSLNCVYTISADPGMVSNAGLILGLRPANERRRYFVTMSLIG